MTSQRKIPVLSSAEIRRWIPKRPAESHKGKNGHVLVVAGSRGMGGAALLVGSGALKSGAGLVTIATPRGLQKTITGRLPEALTLGLPESDEGAIGDHASEIIRAYLKKRKVTVIAMGPGLSVQPAIAALVKEILRNWNGPMVLDADGLNNISASDVSSHPNLVITPHPMELSRFLRMEIDRVQNDRARVTVEAAQGTGGVCVLKGNETVVSDGRAVRINPTGTPAMATGGMGDILTGVIAGLLGQGLRPFEAACAGVYLHGLAANLERQSDRGLLATEVAAGLPAALRKIGIR